LFSEPFYLIQSFLAPWKTASGILSFQDQHIQKIVRHAYNTVPYYRSLFDREELRPEVIRGREDLPKIPVTTKEMLKQAGREIISKDYFTKKLIVETTSGSSGKPLTLYKTPQTIQRSHAAKLRTYFSNGYKIHEKIAEINFDPSRPKFFHRFGLHRTYGIPFYATLSEQIALLQRIRPEVISGYPSRLEELALFKQKNNIKLPRVKNIFTQSEALTEKRRVLIRDQFGADPIEIYATQEFNYIAWECPEHRGLHINADLMVVEIVSTDGKNQQLPAGKPGFVVITDFSNPAMPLIRYNLEDIAALAPAPCPCGRGFPLLQNILGRKISFITLPNQQKIPGDALVCTILAEFPQIRQYRCYQKNDFSLLIEIIKEEGQTVPEEEIREQFYPYCSTLPIRIQYVKGDLKTSRGKVLPFISELE